jgi:hypothetical protein
MNLKQFKLTNDEEIICEVLETEDNPGAEVVVRKVLKLMCIDDYDRNVRYYSFKPWMSFTDDIDGLQTLSLGHIVGQMNPSVTLALHYAQAVKEVESGIKTSRVLNLDDVLKEVDLDELSEDEMDEYLHNKFQADRPKPQLVEDENLDSDGGNIVLFRPKTVH